MEVAYIGLGRIGLPQALVSADKGHTVHGVDNNSHLLSALRKGQVPFNEPYMMELLEKNVGVNFHVQDSLDDLPNKVDIIFFTLGTGVPVYPDKLDLSNIEMLLGEISQKISADVYIFRTTLPVGTVDYLSQKFPNIQLAFVPERLVEGDAVREERKLPKIIGAYNDATYELISRFFSTIGGDIVRVKNPRTAEFCKLTDNSYRNLIFSFSNDIAISAEFNEIDVYEVIDSVNHGYDRNNIMRPGLVSGYCLGKDPYIFEYSFPDDVTGHHSVIYNSRFNNDALYDYVAAKVEQKKAKSVSVLGLSFKSDVDDFRMSHSKNIIARIKKIHGCSEINIYDPYINMNEYTSLNENDHGVKIVSDIENEVIYMSDVVLILTPHKEVKEIDQSNLIKLLEAKSPHIIDIWNAWSFLYGVYGRYQAFGRAS